MVDDPHDDNLTPEEPHVPDPASEPGLGFDLPDVEKPVAYQVLARKYRPRTFDDLVGQEAMVRTLTNAFEMNRIAHAFMLTGVRGVGKTTTARILARGLNFEPKPGSSAKPGPTVDLPELGEHCAAIMESRHVDVLEMDAASRTGIDDIREIIESVRYLPVSARYKVYIIDEVHMLSKAAFNGLLKTLEEPPEHVKFIFATTEIRKVPVTVLSRCQRFDLRRLKVEELIGLLSRVTQAEQAEIEPAALQIIAQAAEGSARDSLSLLDRAIAHGLTEGRAVGEADVREMLGLADRTRIFDLFEAVMRGDVASALTELRAQYDVGADPLIILTDMAELVHWLTRLKLVEAAAGDVAMSETEQRRGTEMAERLPVRTLSRAWQMLLKGIQEVQNAQRPIAAAEMVLVRMAYAADLPAPEDLVAELQDKSRNAGGTAPSGGSPSGSGSGPGPSGHGDPGPQASAPSTAPSGAPRAGMSAAAPSPSPSSAKPQEADPEPQPNAAPERPRAQLRAVPSTGEGPPPAPEAPTGAPVTLASFEAVIALAGDKRDVQLKHRLETQVRLVRFEPGRIDIALVDENAHADLPLELTRKLNHWTGERWVVAQSRERGEETAREKAALRAERLKADALEDPLVQAALATFPGAEIVEVRDTPAIAFEPEIPQGEEEVPALPDDDPFDDEVGEDDLLS